MFGSLIADLQETTHISNKKNSNTVIENGRRQSDSFVGKHLGPKCSQSHLHSLHHGSDHA
jgi:hypothetical protein